MPSPTRSRPGTYEFRFEERTRGIAQRVIDDLREEAAGSPEMTLEEINAEIAAARSERKVQSKNLRADGNLPSMT